MTQKTILCLTNVLFYELSDRKFGVSKKKKINSSIFVCYSSSALASYIFNSLLAEFDLSIFLVTTFPRICHMLAPASTIPSVS